MTETYKVLIGNMVWVTIFFNVWGCVENTQWRTTASL